MKLIATIITLAFFACYTDAQTITWTGAGDGLNWSDKDNWSTGFLPNDGDRVIINNADTVVMNVTDDIKSMTLSNTHFTINSGVSLTLLEGSPFENEMIITSDAMLVNHGILYIESGALAIKIISGILSNLNQLNILVADSTGIENNGMLLNEGSISISNVNDGIQNKESLFNGPNASIIINDISGIGIETRFTNDTLINDGVIAISNSIKSGIENNGFLKNTETIQIDQAGDDGIQNNNKIENTPSGRIDITKINGIETDGIHSGSNSTIINEGFIRIEDVTGRGIYSQGLISNHDSILIKLTGHNGLESADSVYNGQSAVIHITNTFYYGLNNLGNANNLGEIFIEKTMDRGLRNLGAFSNSGMLDIKGSQINGIANSDSIFNGNNGNIFIDSTSGLSPRGLSNSNSNSVIINLGSIDIKNTDLGIFNFGTINNYKLISIKNGSTGITNSGFIQNKIGSRIHISNIIGLNANGIKNNSEDTFFNAGVVRIDSVSGTFSEGMRNGGILINQDSIIITAVGFRGIINFDTLRNELNGVIDISDVYNSDSKGFFNSTTTSQTTNDGKMEISMTADDGIVNDGELIISSTGSCLTYMIGNDPLIVPLDAILDCMGIMDIQN